jgi:hypothetical protein
MYFSIGFFVYLPPPLMYMYIFGSRTLISIQVNMVLDPRLGLSFLPLS